MKPIISPVDDKTIVELTAGDPVALSGVVYTARDLAHQRFAALLEAGSPLPLDLRGQTIFYAGPAPAPPGRAIGSIGPTTAKRMDPFTPLLLKYGVKIMIGKGNRSDEVKEAMIKYRAAYLVATGGVAAYLSQFVTRAEIMAFADLGPEAVHRLEVKDLPLVVGIDHRGRSCIWPDSL